MKRISISEAISYGWRTFWQRPLLFVELVAVVVVLDLVMSPWKPFGNSSVLALLLSVVYLALGLYISIGILKASLRVYDGESPAIGDVLLHSGGYFWRCIGATILYGLAVIVGMALFIVPGFILAIMYSQVANLIVDRDMPILEAFGKSAQLTKGVKWQLFLFGLFCGVVVVLGAAALVVGLFVAIPVVWLAQVYVYRHLLELSKDEAPSAGTGLPSAEPPSAESVSTPSAPLPQS